MSVYVMSDIHGCFDEFKCMLNKIQFCKNDILVCAGDYIDRGTQSLEMMRWIMNAPQNVVFVRGNHDEEFMANVDIIKNICNKVKLNPDNIEDSKTLYDAVSLLCNENDNSFFDYYGTIGNLIKKANVTFSELCSWSDKISVMPYFYKTSIGNRTCIIVHAGYIKNLEKADTEETYNSPEDFYLYARDDAYMYGGIEHGMIIAGHTPTIAEEEFPYNDGNVFRMYDKDQDCIFYDIDCGCAMNKFRSNAKLACIRLEDEKIYYVSSCHKI